MNYIENNGVYYRNHHGGHHHNGGHNHHGGHNHY
ncbi:cobalt transporter, partial [Bacillus toyonensis]